MGKLVLLIDDDEAIRMVLRMTFEDAGFLVKEAGDGFEGMAMIQEHEPDLIVLDLFMPKQDGFETLQSLEKLKTPIFVISGGGHGFAPHLTAAQHMGAVRTFAKPFDRNELLEAAREVLAD